MFIISHNTVNYIKHSIWKLELILPLYICITFLVQKNYPPPPVKKQNFVQLPNLGLPFTILSITLSFLLFFFLSCLLPVISPFPYFFSQIDFANIFTFFSLECVCDRSIRPSNGINVRRSAIKQLRGGGPVITVLLLNRV
jgi:hypothetical protein